MPSWTTIVEEINQLGNSQNAVYGYIKEKISWSLGEICRLRNGNNVIFYASAFVQKPHAEASAIIITNEELNGFMAVMHGMDFNKQLTLILHTPGGMTNATETVVEYIHSKFKYVEVIVPTLAMSAGTMISLSADKIIMGRASQLGPIDPQMSINGQSVSARSVVEQVALAKSDIKKDIALAHVWAPILGNMTPGLIVEAENASDYSERMVARWLERKGHLPAKAKAIASHFNSSSVHKSHGRRIDRTEALGQGLDVEELEKNQDLQESVLTAYHVVGIYFDKSLASKMIVSNNNDKTWVKNLPPRTPSP